MKAYSASSSRIQQLNYDICASRRDKPKKALTKGEHYMRKKGFIVIAGLTTIGVIAGYAGFGLGITAAGAMALVNAYCDRKEKLAETKK